ncbi:CHAT domain-containing protein [Streptomyces sp. ID01-12c]|uniref:CHAT domain-containing protein n=1 Tax=Streptomyces caniscabiei TaxID=2746961 RepID=A0A927L7D9_9ACTN|nr:CHAT domain-containing protein [Streptomyces caniscabiei]MBD9703665.1 CHAT domain-containing protein [Streptomyces caniscabiei]MBD9726767.1 CHAT domain-containing protein [Streptomyces caniscabiei]MDX3515993.1 CHAT domain-containing protein [Streptomyces caniscabiei]MDX3723642.1 CHAT domain-containing protein [Streptomyces caniscabiei]MDX3733706.1 CHAT domain-containing protein [Streptomyces caniscabiei]
MESLPFRIKIIETDTEWFVECWSEFGEASMRVPPPCSREKLQTELHGVERSLEKSYSLNIVRGASAPEKSVREFGKLLTRTILPNKIFAQFDRCRMQAKAQGKSLRVLLRPDGPLVSRIPWEYMVDPARDDYLALRVPVVRDLRLMDPISPMPLALPLRVLGISAVPDDLPPLEAQHERERIAQVLQQDSSEKVDVHWLPGDRWQDLAGALGHGTWHVLHCVCHGGFDKEGDEGYIQLSGDDGAAMRFHARDFRRLIERSPQLRLVVLNTCESAVSGSDNVFTSTAASLVEAGVPAVVAMQYEITDRAAITFASAFYERIAEGTPVDRAVTLAREEVKVRLGSLEWATPVLFLASETAQIFASQSTPPGPNDSSQSTPPGPNDSPGNEPQTPPDETPQALARLRLVAEVGPCGHMALGPANLLAVACADGVVRVLDATSGELAAQCMPVQREKPVRLAWSPWRRHVASRHKDGTVVIWDLQTELPARVISAGEHGAALAFSSDGHWLALTVGNHVHVYDPRGARVRDLSVAWPKEAQAWSSSQNAPLGPLTFAPGDRYVVVACGDGVVRQLNARGLAVMTWRHPQPVHSLVATDDLLATGCLDGRVRLWSWQGQLLWRTQPGPTAYQLAFADEYAAMAVAHQRGEVAIRNVHTGTPSLVTRLESWPVGLAFLKDDYGLVTASRSGSIECWELPDWLTEKGDGP